jgi:hypothetical protein
MRREDAREVPGTFGDPARFVETMPGVVPTSSGLQSFFVRGAPPETTGYFLDGVPIPALYHVGFGPSVVHPALLDRVSFFPGAAPAYFGRSIGAVIAGDTAGPASRAHGEANARLLDTRALVETPFGDGRGSVLAAGRYGYPALLVPLFAPNVGLSFWDYQTRATWDLSDRERVSALVFGSYDRLTEKDNNGAGIPYTRQLVATQFHRADLRYDRALGGSSSLRLAATLGHDSAGDETLNVKDTLARLRAEVDTRVSPDVRMRVGADVAWDHFGLGSSPIDPADPSSAAPYGQGATLRNDLVVGLRGDMAWRVSPRVEIVPGLRGEIFTSRRIDVPSNARGADATATPTLDPRLAARITLAKGVAAVSTVGLAHQVPGLVAVAPDASPLLRSPGVLQGVQSSAQMSQGFDVALPEGFLASATGFLHHYTGLADVTAAFRIDIDPSRCLDERVDGKAYGLEVLVRRALTERFAVLVAYTLSRSIRQSHVLNPAVGPQPMAGWIPSEYDRTHVVSAMAAYDLGRRWRVGARFYGYTGRPYTHTYQGFPILPYNTERLPGFWRLDVRLEKSWLVGSTGRVSVVLEGLNVTLNKEVVDVSCQQSVPRGIPFTGGPLPPGATYDRCSVDELGPIAIPSLGVEGAF